jgi:hypothetical protein
VGFGTEIIFAFEYHHRPQRSIASRATAGRFIERVLVKVVLQVSNADRFVAERLACVLRLPTRRGCR